MLYVVSVLLRHPAHVEHTCVASSLEHAQSIAARVKQTISSDKHYTVQILVADTPDEMLESIETEFNDTASQF